MSDSPSSDNTGASYFRGIVAAKLTVKGSPVSDCSMVSMRFDEGVSRPYRLRLEFVVTKEIDVGGWLDCPASIELFDQDASGARGGASFPVNGIVVWAEHSWSDSGQPEHIQHGYRIEVAPKLWRATYTRNTRVFTESKVTEVIDRVLKPYGVKIRDRVAARYQPLANITQHQESDFAFVSRLMEQEGIFYFFEHTTSGEELVLGDSDNAHPGEAVQAEADHLETYAGDNASQGERTGARFSHTLAAGKSHVQDYDPKHPSTPLDASVDAANRITAESSWKLNDFYGQYARSGEDATRYAKVRVQEQACRRLVMEARSYSPGIRSGYLLKLSNHAAASRNVAYMIVEVVHSYSPTDGYHCDFRAIPKANLPFRPLRQTPVPAIPGFLLARVEGGVGDDDKNDGAYKVSLLLADESASPSRVARMSQPYGGSSRGMHFPLPVGAEVLLAHINGDPDRPIIAGSPPNIDDPSQVLASNKTQCVVRTASGASLVFEDDENALKVSLTSAKGHALLLDDAGKLISVTSTGANKLAIDDNDDSITIEAGKKLVLKSGSASITLESDGKITIDGGEIVITGSTKLGAKAPEVAIAGDSKAEIKAAQLSLKGDGMVEVKGGVIKLN